jgi:Ankyrin repeats (3 copies)/Ankyrin repeats (many copies)
MSIDWNPAGLETPASEAGAARTAAIVLCLVLALGIPWCYEQVGSIHPLRGTRACGAAPAGIRAWSRNGHSRRPEEAVDLRNWITAHPDRIDKRYGAFCDTPVHLAARFGREDLADLLISSGANVEALNEHDERPLHAAAAYGRPAVVKLLLAGGADVNARGPAGKTPLHAAAFGVGVPTDVDERTDVAKLLLAAGADVNARQPGSGFTPLRYASSAGSPARAMVDLLLANGADPRGAE